MIEKKLNNARIVHKGDIEANWKKATGFVPLAKEIIIYLPDENYDYCRMKIGDGANDINNLPFIDDYYLASKDWVVEQAGVLTENLQEYVGNSVQGLATEGYVNSSIANINFPQPDWNQNNGTAKDYIKNRPFYDVFEWKEIINDTYTTKNIVGKIHQAYCNYYAGMTISEKPIMIKVLLDGVEYNNLIPIDSQHDSGWVVGNGSILNSIYGTSYEKTDEPFVVTIKDTECILNVGASQVTTHNFALFIFINRVVPLDEKYLPDKLINKVADLEGKVVTAIFNIKNANTKIKLQSLGEQSKIKIDWGDGIVDANPIHIYTEIGEYNCKIYGVTSIGYNAFVNSSNLTSVIIGDGVTSIGEDAFYGCDSLTNIIIPDSITTIGNRAFSYCDSLTSVVIPDSVTTIGDSAFYYCTSLTSVVIGNGVTSLPKGLFGGCNSLKSITLPFVGGSKTATLLSSTLFGYIFGTSSYTGSYEAKQYYSYGDYATYYIPSSLKEVTITGGNILYGEFSSCSSLTSIEIPDSVTSIGEDAFYNCSSLTNIVIPDSVTEIGSDAFSGCSNLTSAVIPDNVTSIGDRTFANCDSLTSVVIPDSVTSIGKQAFAFCDNLTSVEIGDSVTSIGNYAFENCSSLTSVEIGDSVTSIGNGAFYSCSRLTSITFKNLIPIDYNVITPWFKYCDCLTHIYVPCGCIEVYKEKWGDDGAEQTILDKIVEFDREAMMSDVNEIKTSTQDWVMQYIRDNFATLMEEYLAANSASYDEIVTTSEEGNENE